MWFTLLSVFTLIFFSQIKSHGLSDDVTSPKNETFCIPVSIQLYEEEIISVTNNCSWLNSTYATLDAFEVTIRDGKVATLLNPRSPELGNSTFFEDVIIIKGLFLGRTEAIFEYKLHPAGPKRISSMKISVIRRERIIDHMFIGFVTLLMMFAYIGMGCSVDLAEVKEVLRKPIAPVIGFLSQYVVMPLAAFAVVKFLNLSGGIALGFFASGCAPGGGASNMYTYLLGGDSSLSVTMTLISTIASLGMFPLWLNTLGRLVYDTHGHPLKVPFTNIFTSLAVMIIPLAIGALIKIKKPNWAKKTQKIMRPFFAIIILLLISLGTWSNLYLFQLISPWLILGACVLSYSGFLFGGLLAFAFRFKWSRVIAVAVETGVQNTGLPILLLKFSLPQPDADLSVVSPVTVAMLMPVPLWLAIAFLEIKKKCKSSSVQTMTSNSEVKVLKMSEVNGGPIQFVEVCCDRAAPDKTNLEAVEVGDMKISNGATEGKPHPLPNGAGDAQVENEKF